MSGLVDVKEFMIVISHDNPEKGPEKKGPGVRSGEDETSVLCRASSPMFSKFHLVESIS